MRWVFILLAMAGLIFSLQHFEKSLHLFKETAFVLPMTGIHVSWALCMVAFILGLGAAKLRFGN